MSGEEARAAEMGIKGQGDGERPFITMSSTLSPSRSQERKLEYRTGASGRWG